MNVFDLSAKLTLDTSEYERGLDNSAKKAGGFGTTLATAGKVGVAAVTALAAGATALVGSIASATKQTAEYGDNIDKMSQKLGLSADAYQRWDYVLGQAGVDINSMSTGLKTLTNQIDNAKNGSADAQAKFAALGISMEDLGSMSREEIFEAAISGFQGMADSTERAALANDLFGRSGQELTPLFNSTIEETEALKQAASELGFVMSDESVKAAADYMDALDTLKRTIGGVKNALTAEFLPSITSVMEGLSKVFSGDKGGLAQVQEGISDFLEGITQRLPEFVQTGMEIILALASGIAENLPAMIQALIDTIVASLPTLIQGAIQLVAGLVAALPEIIAGLIAAIPDILAAIIEGFAPIVEQLGEVFSKAWEAIKAIFAPVGEWFTERKEDVQNAFAAVDTWFSEKFTAARDAVHTAWSAIGSWFGERWADIQSAMQSVNSWFSEKFTSAKDAVHTAWNGIGSFFSEKWTQIKDVFSDAWSIFKGIGGNIVKGLIAGIGEWISSAVQKARELIQSVKSAANSEAGIRSPSRVFRQMGRYIDKGLMLGIDDEEDKPVNAITQIMKKLMGAGQGLRFSSSMSYSASRSSGYSSGEEPMQPIILQVVLDGKVIGETSYNYIRRRTRMVGA